MPETSSVCDVDTLTFFLNVIPFPKTTTEDYLRQSVGDIISLMNKPKMQLPFLAYGDNTNNAISAIATLLKRSIPIPDPVVPTLPLPVNPMPSTSPAETPTPSPTPTATLVHIPFPEIPAQTNIPNASPPIAATKLPTP